MNEDGETSREGVFAGGIRCRCSHRYLRSGSKMAAASIERYIWKRIESKNGAVEYLLHCFYV